MSPANTLSHIQQSRAFNNKHNVWAETRSWELRAASEPGDERQFRIPAVSVIVKCDPAMIWWWLGSAGNSLRFECLNLAMQLYPCRYAADRRPVGGMLVS
jgi:hypothetical protein